MKTLQPGHPLKLHIISKINLKAFKLCGYNKHIFPKYLIRLLHRC